MADPLRCSGSHLVDRQCYYVVEFLGVTHKARRRAPPVALAAVYPVLPFFDLGTGGD